jgi:outer membrane protein, heavy metal efflux system
MNYVNMVNWKYMMQYIKITMMVLMFPFLALSQNKEVLSLPEIIQKIDQNNLLLKVYSDRAESYKYSADAATAWMPPMIGLGTWATPYPFQEVMDPRDKGMLMFRIEQEIPVRSKLNARRRFIESQGNAELANRAVVLNDLKAEARKQYFTWLVALQKIAVLQKNEQVLSMMRKIEEVRYPYNQSQLSSVYRSDAAMENNAAMVQMQVGEIERAKGTLNALMNRQGNEDFTIDTTYDVKFTPVSQIDTASLAFERRDVLRMNENIRSMQLNIEAMRLERRPGFRIQFDHMQPFDDMMPKAFSVMGMMSIPFAPWSSKMYKSDIRAMELNIRAMETERSAMLQETQGMLYAMQNEILSMQKRINAIESKVIPALQKTFDANYILYQENKLSVTVLLDSWEALNMMRNELLDDKQRLYQMIADYEKEIYR